MALPDFKKMTQDKNAVPEWAKYLNKDQFISYTNSYTSKIYFDLFDEYVYESPEGNIKYYVYNPVKHGADPEKKYPVLMWLHGASNSLMGVGCIMCCGAEQYASPSYQEKMGGAFIIVPLANEIREDSGRILGAWDESYCERVKAIYDKVCADNNENIGKKFIMGASSGGRFTWNLLEYYNDYFDGAIPISSGYFPSYDTLDKIEEKGIYLLIAHGKHDEMAIFDECIEPHLDRLNRLKNCICFFPEWVYNGDGGVSSVFYGFEMGQHCMINWIQHNLMFDNGKPADDRLPDGVTGWIRDVCQK